MCVVKLSADPPACIVILLINYRGPGSARARTCPRTSPLRGPCLVLGGGPVTQGRVRDNVRHTRALAMRHTPPHVGSQTRLMCFEGVVRDGGGGEVSNLGDAGKGRMSAHHPNGNHPTILCSITDMFFGVSSYTILPTSTGPFSPTHSHKIGLLW